MGSRYCIGEFSTFWSSAGLWWAACGFHGLHRCDETQIAWSFDRGVKGLGRPASFETFIADAGTTHSAGESDQQYMYGSGFAGGVGSDVCGLSWAGGFACDCFGNTSPYGDIGEAFALSRLPKTPIAEVADNSESWMHYIYTFLGDPEMTLWTGAIDTMAVTHVDSVGYGTSGITVNVTDSGGVIEGATVCLSKGLDDYEVGTTNVSGNAGFSFTTK